jgi:hypothetical protein
MSKSTCTTKAFCGTAYCRKCDVPDSKRVGHEITIIHLLSSDITQVLLDSEQLMSMDDLIWDAFITLATGETSE